MVLLINTRCTFRWLGVELGILLFLDLLIKIGPEIHKTKCQLFANDITGVSFNSQSDAAIKAKTKAPYPSHSCHFVVRHSKYITG